MPKLGEDRVNKLMKTMDESFYKMNTAVRLADYDKKESEKCSWCKYKEVCFQGLLLKN